MLPRTSDQALELLRRGFPGCDIEVCDCHELNDGTIEEAGMVTSYNHKIASFALLYSPRDPEVVAEIRLGMVGRYCGTVEEQHAFQRNR